MVYLIVPTDTRCSQLIPEEMSAWVEDVKEEQCPSITTSLCNLHLPQRHQRVASFFSYVRRREYEKSRSYEKSHSEFKSSECVNTWCRRRRKSAVHPIVRETIFVLKQRSVQPSADLSILDFPLH